MKRVRRNQDAVSRRDFVKAAAVGAGAACLTAFGAEETKAEGRPARWDTEADVVVIGAGATGLPAAIQAAEAGASVILIDANTDVGGHAIVSGGNVALGGGTSNDTRSGLRINVKCQVVDLNGEVIQGLYCGGESAGGFSMHGLARCAVQGRIAGKNAAAEQSKG